MASIAQTPLSVFTTVTTCQTTWPRPHLSRRQWSATAQMLDHLLRQPILHWATLDLATLQDLRDETWTYPSIEETWELDEEDLPDPATLEASPWTVVARAAELVAYQTLPVIPNPSHPFY